MVVSETSLKTANYSDMILSKWSDWPVEIYLSSTAFSNEAARTRKKISFKDKSFYVLSAEAICVFKVLLYYNLANKN